MIYGRKVRAAILILVMAFAWTHAAQLDAAEPDAAQVDAAQVDAAEPDAAGQGAVEQQNDNGRQNDSGQNGDDRQRGEGTRNIYIGDLITIEVVSQTISRRELEEKFSEFEIVDIKKTDKGFLITVRSFVPGEKVVNLGDKEIVITINSALADIQRDDVFEGDTSPEGAGFAMDWRYLFFALLAVFLATGVLLLRKYLAKRRASRLSPYSRFIGRCRLLQFSDRFYYAKLTMYFKEYIESVYNIGIKGKTTGEIMDSINRLPGLQQVLPGIENWLRESDYYKFSGVAASNEKKRILIDELVEVVNRIERENKDND